MHISFDQSVQFVASRVQVGQNVLNILRSLEDAIVGQAVRLFQCVVRKPVHYAFQGVFSQPSLSGNGASTGGQAFSADERRKHTSHVASRGGRTGNNGTIVIADVACQLLLHL